MKVVVFGSWKETDRENWALGGDIQTFRKACRQLGELLARKANEVFVGYDQEDAADTHIVNGILCTLRRKKHNKCFVRVFRDTVKNLSPFEKVSNQHRGVFQFRKPHVHWWEAVHDAILQADLVILIGGGTGTLIAGHTSILAGKRIVPIGGFGGAASQLFEGLVKGDENCHSQDDKILLLRATWCRKVLTHVEHLLNFPRVLLVHGRSKDWCSVKRYLRHDLRLPRPVVMTETFAGAQTLTEKWEFLARGVDCAIVVATPDDYATATLNAAGKRIAKQAWDFEYRARENVWVEMGWFWGSRGRKNVLLLKKGQCQVPSDLAMERHEYHDDPLEQKRTIAAFVRKVDRGLLTRSTV